MNTSLGYSKKTLTNSNVLLSGGGDKALSEFIGSLNWDSTNKKLQYKSASSTNFTDLITFGSNAFTSYSGYNIVFLNNEGTTVDTFKALTSPSKTLKAGTNVQMTAASNVITITATDTTYSVFTGASSSNAGSTGLVKLPSAGDLEKFLRGDSTWLAINLNVTSALYVGASDGTGNSAQSTNGNVYLIFAEGSSYSRYKIVGSGRASVTSDANGNITINSSGYSNFGAATATTAGSAGLVPAPGANILGTGGYFLRADGSWIVPTNTWKAANNSQEGYVPKLNGNGTIATQSTEYVLAFTSGGTGTITPTWKLLPTNAFVNTWTAWVGATNESNGTAGYMPAPTSALRGQFLRGDGSWVSLNNYSLPTATNEVLGGVKTGAAITDITGYTAVAIKDGVIYYKDTTYSFSNLRFLQTSGTNLMIYNSRAARTVLAGSNITFTHNDNVLTIAATDTWNANAVGVAGYVAAPTKAANANMTWLTDAEGVPAWRASNNHSHSYLPLSGGTMTGHITMGGLAIYFGKTGNNAIMSYSSSYPNYGIWYNDASVDTMTFSATGNANDAATADFAINGGGDGVLTSRGNKILHVGNSSVSKSGETLTVNIGGTSQSLTNTWRGIQNNLTSDSTTDSLSAAQGKVLNNKFGNYLPLSGGTMTGNITMGTNSIIFNQATTSNWNVGANTGIMLLNTVGASTTGAPGLYHVGLSVSGYYGFQLAAYGGGGRLLFRNTKRGDYPSWSEIALLSDIAWSNVTGRPDPYKSTSLPGYLVTHSAWSYMRFISGDNLWDIGTHQSAGGWGSNAGFGIRENGQDNNGIYVKRNTSSYGKLCVGTPSGECSIGYYVGGSAKWTVGCSDGTNFGWYQGSSGGWKMTLSTSGDLTATNFYTTSDRLKKQNISLFSEHIRKFQLKDTEKWYYGVIALEVPEMFRDGEEGNMTVNYNSVLSYYIGLLELKVLKLENKLKKYEDEVKKC